MAENNKKQVQFFEGKVNEKVCKVIYRYVLQVMGGKQAIRRKRGGFLTEKIKLAQLENVQWSENGEKCTR